MAIEDVCPWFQFLCRVFEESQKSRGAVVPEKTSLRKIKQRWDPLWSRSRPQLSRAALSHGHCSRPHRRQPLGSSRGEEGLGLGGVSHSAFHLGPLLALEGGTCVSVCVCVGGTYSGHTLRSRLHLDVEGE